MKHTIIVDIDGTIADLSHRLHHIGKNMPSGTVAGKKDWKAFHASVGDDALHEDIAALLHVFRASLGDTIDYVYVSGRVERTRADTERWLAANELPDGPLYMRADGDFRNDSIVKSEIVDRIGLTPADVWFVLDDRDRVVRMWRDRGFRCLQVADGAF